MTDSLHRQDAHGCTDNDYSAEPLGRLTWCPFNHPFASHLLLAVMCLITGSGVVWGQGMGSSQIIYSGNSYPSGSYSGSTYPGSSYQGSSYQGVSSSTYPSQGSSQPVVTYPATYPAGSRVITSNGTLSPTGTLNSTGTLGSTGTLNSAGTLGSPVVIHGSPAAQGSSSTTLTHPTPNSNTNRSDSSNQNKSLSWSSQTASSSSSNTASTFGPSSTRLIAPPSLSSRRSDSYTSLNSSQRNRSSSSDPQSYSASANLSLAKTRSRTGESQSSSSRVPTRLVSQAFNRQSAPNSRGSEGQSGNTRYADSGYTDSQYANSRFADTRFVDARLNSNSRLDARYDDLRQRQTQAYEYQAIQAARDAAEHFRSIARSTGNSRSDSVVADLALDNASFVDRWISLAESIGTIAHQVDQANDKLDSTRYDYDDVNTKLNHYGLTPTIGLLLRNKQEQLGRWQAEDSQTLFASQELGRSRQEQLELEMVQHDGSRPREQSQTLLNEVDIDATSSQNLALASQVQDLLQQRYHWLTSLREGYQYYQQKLGELDSSVNALSLLSSEYRTLIDQHVTWIRSGDPVGTDDLRQLKSGVPALFSSRRSGEFGQSLEDKWRTGPGAGIGLLISIIVIMLARWYAKSWLLNIGEKTRMRTATADSRKVAAGVLTVLVASAIPAILYLVARWLGNGLVTESTLHASSGFYAASLVAWMVEVPRQLLRKSGYVDKHVDVDLPRRDRATTYLTLIGMGLVLAAYLTTLAGLIDAGMWRDSVARFGFMTAMLLVAWTAHLSLRPNGGFLEPLIAKFGGRVIHRVRFLLYFAGIGFPIAMLGLSALGYGLTANELIQRVIFTLIGACIAATLWGGIKILSAGAWHMLTGSAVNNANSQTGSSRYSRESSFGYSDDEPAPTGQVTGVLGEHFLELKHHLAFLCQCGLVLAGIVAVGWLWIDVFPNAKMGNPVVWTIQDTVTKSSLDATGNPVVRSVAEATPITVMHLVLAATTLFVAFQLAKLLPALFDALVLQRVSFDEGMEHFSLVLGRCLLFGVGCFIACKWIGIRWQAIQWLAVGLTIGVGFGLQDMVRNLFGGLIVLFEKPARLGDFISVGKVTGRVSAQRLRTTVLSDDDGREVIVPNKNFVSEDVTNWMGAGRLNVIAIEVAVTRDERPADICRSLQELTIEQDEVLLTPAPQATLVCVGKRSQRIELRAWIEDDRNISRFRDSLLKTVRRYLEDRRLLAVNQPTQPSVRDIMDDEPLLSTSRPRRKRPA
ncbi:mechanosensitive ion channel domain-containing protein [Neorhodopirellula lusitana]|uniref:mechanosensitive ion channel domain-containing protein n=1 Tax=Neorhodopirellula lusitana TaxID=445327 RepID=UPI00384EC746